MVLVIDTSSAIHGLAVVRDGVVEAEEVFAPERGGHLAERVARLAAVEALTAVAIATGPGSFTGLRVGAAFGLGLAMGRRLPLLTLATLEIQAARARVPALGLAEAGRGRVYFEGPDGPRVGEPIEVPSDLPAVGWLRPETAESLRAARVHLLAEDRLRSFGDAVAGLLGRAREVAYGTVTLRYVQSLGTLA